MSQNPRPESEPRFHLFPQLPTELREEIWRFCLPSRIISIDAAVGFIVFDTSGSGLQAPCQLYHTTFMNNRPPLLTQICRESRAVAFETGDMAMTLVAKEARQIPPMANWASGTMLNYDYWEDPARDSAHLNWSPACDADFGCMTDGHPLHSTAWEAKRLNGKGSLMLEYMTDSMSTRGNDLDLEAFRALPEWTLVTKVIAVHSDHQSAAASGLFGLLGDAPIQIVPISEEARIDKLYNLAEACERRAGPLIVSQDFTRMSTGAMADKVKDVVTTQYDESLANVMRPAIMFRLCTQMCNRGIVEGEGW